jgi:hypothetical protein
MYIGEFYLQYMSDCWPKNTIYPVTLYKPGEDGSLVALTAENGGPKIVFVTNVIGTFGYKSAAFRYVSVVKINEQYFAISAEC